jgi:adenine phosphoribosyltransferase
MPNSIADKLKSSIRSIPDFPNPGINFYDITTVLKDGALNREVIESLSEAVRKTQAQAILGIEARGFVFGGAVAYSLGLPFIPVRKPGKLPAEVEEVSYELEYGQDSLEVHRDALARGLRVAIVDDLLATGGTAAAVCSLAERLGAEVALLAFVVELNFLSGRRKLESRPVVSLVEFDS